VQRGIARTHNWRCWESNNPLFSVMHLVDPRAETRESRMQDTGYSDVGHSLGLGPGFRIGVSRVSKLCWTVTVMNV